MATGPRATRRRRRAIAARLRSRSGRTEKPRVVVLAPEPPAPTRRDRDRDDFFDDPPVVASASSNLAVAWNSGRDATHTPRLRWWLPGSPEDAVESPATTTTFAREDLCGSPADGVGWRHPGYTHVARIVGAPPDEPSRTSSWTTSGEGFPPSMHPTRGSRCRAGTIARRSETAKKAGTVFLVDAARVFEPVVLVSCLLVGDVRGHGSRHGR